MGRWVQLTDDDPYLFGAQLVTAQLKWCRRWRFDPLKVLYLLRSVAYFPYHESTITHLAAMGHSVEVLADRDRSKDRVGWRAACSPGADLEPEPRLDDRSAPQASVRRSGAA